MPDARISDTGETVTQRNGLSGNEGNRSSQIPYFLVSNFSVNVKQQHDRYILPNLYLVFGLIAKPNEELELNI
jgi:hypothetical protein